MTGCVQVYKVTWRGQQVALKKIHLPQEPRGGAHSAEAKRALARQLKKVIRNFVKEVRMCSMIRARRYCR